MIRIVFFVLAICCSLSSFGQEETPQFAQRTFKDTRVINTHSVEVLPKRKLDVRIGHRFGDLVGTSGGWQTFYGLENAADVLIGVDYGITNNVTVGLFRTKGAGRLKQLVNGTLKYRVLQQGLEGGSPVTITAYGVSSLSTMKKSTDPEALHFFPKSIHRMSYAVQFLIARKFSDRISLQLIPSYVHRNFVLPTDVNDLVSMGGALRIQMTKVFGLIADITVPFSDELNRLPAIGVGLEIDTGGHIFQVNFTNARGIVETDYIPYTTSDWAEGQFRLGFTVSRLFNL